MILVMKGLKFSGSLFNDVNYKVLCNDNNLEEQKARGLKSGRIDLYVDHACDNKEAKKSGGKSEKDEGSEESAYKSENDDRSEESVESDAEEDSEDEDYNVNFSDCDDEWDEVCKERKKNMHIKEILLKVLLMI